MAEKNHPDADAPVMTANVMGAGEVTVKASDPMPEAEPFHRIADKSDVFDPNAARREKENRGPGLQDSEALNPAHWVQYSDEEAIEAEIKRLDREIKRLQEEKKAVREGNL